MEFSRSSMLRGLWLAFITSVLIGTLVSLASVSDSSYVRSFLELAMNLAQAMGRRFSYFTVCSVDSGQARVFTVGCLFLLLDQLSMAVR